MEKYLNGPIELGVDSDAHNIGAFFDADLFNTFPFPSNDFIHLLKSCFDQFAHTVRFPSGNDDIVGFILLEHHPHRLQIQNDYPIHFLLPGCCRVQEISKETS